MQTKRLWPQFCKIIILSTFFAFSPLFFTIAYAEPVASDDQSSGWVEVNCTVPDDFHDPVTLVISEDASGEIYSVICREINGYIGRAALPCGDYTIFQVYAADDRPASCDISTFSITDTMKAAQAIFVTVEGATGATLIDPENDNSDSGWSSPPVPVDDSNIYTAADDGAASTSSITNTEDSLASGTQKLHPVPIILSIVICGIVVFIIALAIHKHRKG